MKKILLSILVSWHYWLPVVVIASQKKRVRNGESTNNDHYKKSGLPERTCTWFQKMIVLPVIKSMNNLQALLIVM